MHQESSISEQYSALFPDPKRALDQAHDLRKFEIELYWKRSTYFWAIIAVAFIGFFASSGEAPVPAADKPSDALIIACLGFLFSIGWYLVNRASSWAHRCWEIRLRLLEDAVMGPLHKSIMREYGHSRWEQAGPNNYSIVKINATLSLAVAALWVVLAAKVISENYQKLPWPIAAAALLITIGVAVWMVLIDRHRHRDTRWVTFQILEYVKGGADTR